LAFATFVVVACAIAGIVLVRDSMRSRLITVRDVAIVVEGRQLSLSPWNDGSTGVGVAGRIELIADRCVGLVGSNGVGRVIVWPAGTRVSGVGQHLRITSEGKTVWLHQDVEAGSEFGHDFTGIKQKLPPTCRKAALVQVGLSS
jgi:hypothetical protein